MGVTPATVARGEQSNTTVFYGHSLALKLFRRLEAGIHPQVEVERYLANDGSLAHVPRLLGTAEIGSGSRLAAAGILEAYVPSECDAWTFTVDELRRQFEELIAGRPEPPAAWSGTLLAASEAGPPPEVSSWALGFFELMETLGRRAGQLHMVMGAGTTAAFAPEAFNPFEQRTLAEGLRDRARSTFRLLRETRSHLGESDAELADRVLQTEREVLSRLGAVANWKLRGKRIRCHGDFHLGQVLYTGNDFVIIDFEGEPARALGERRIKRSPLVDVAGMLRSLNYALHHVLASEGDYAFAPADREFLRPWGAAWFTGAGSAFLRGYLAEAAAGSFLPPDAEELTKMLSLHLLDKAVYELAYELQNRPGWVHVPLEGILDCLAGPGQS
jgi:maltose alpha-D-glucosyltransferase/alpha-amylase